MRSIQTIVCLAFLFESCWAGFSYNELKVNIFDNRPRNFEANILKSLQVTKNWAASDAAKYGADAASKVVGFIPVAGEFSAIIPMFRSILASEDDWRQTFAHAISEEISMEIADDNIRRISDAMRTIKNNLVTLNRTKELSEHQQTNLASNIHSDVNTLISHFQNPTSIFKRQPLFGAPLLIQLALWVTYFDPVAQRLIPVQNSNPQLSCKMYDVLLDYRPRIVNARLEKLRVNENVRIYGSKLEAMNEPFNQYGYNKTNPGVLECDLCAEQLKTSPRGDKICFRDLFGSQEYFLRHIFYLPKPEGFYTCAREYAKLVRYRVEQMLPIEILNGLCKDENRQKPTAIEHPFGCVIVLSSNAGNYKRIVPIVCDGWLTIKFMWIQATRDSTGAYCDSRDIRCDPYIKIFVNGVCVHETAKNHEDTPSYDPQLQFTTEKISKKSTIKIETWDDDEIFLHLNGDDDLIQSVEGSAEQFAANSIPTTNDNNRIEIVSFWKDQYPDE